MIQCGELLVEPLINVFIPFFKVSVKAGDCQFNEHYTFFLLSMSIILSANARASLRCMEYFPNFLGGGRIFFMLASLPLIREIFGMSEYNEIIHKVHSGTHQKMNLEEGMRIISLGFTWRTIP